SWKQAEAARDESGGLIDMVSDDAIIAAYKQLATGDGIYAEPASCASVAGLLKLAKSGYFLKNRPAGEDATIVCILTGHGLKDPDRAIKTIGKPKVVKASKEAILNEIGY
ncbi:MAG: threonine synthase, partial [Candidatus Omnitrophica bacterium]|nr:threonine synthase [Candidatus Omnitrophota bacterium]